MVNMNWADETGGDFKVYPEATYKVRIVSFERVSASTGTEQIRWKAEIVEPDAYHGCTIIEHTALTTAALWRTASLVKACGVNTINCPVMDTDGPAFNQILTACKERTLFWLVQEEVGNNGKPRNRIVDYSADPDLEVIEPQQTADIKWE